MKQQTSSNALSTLYHSGCKNSITHNRNHIRALSLSFSLCIVPSFSTKAILDSLAESCNRRIHVLRACRGKCGTEVQARQGTGILSLEPRSSGHEHTALDARVEDFLLNLQEASTAGAGVLGVVNGEPELWK